MTDELENPDIDAAAVDDPQAASAAGDDLDRLMKPEEADGADGEAARLEAVAIAAARAAVADAESAVSAFQSEVSATEDEAATQLAAERARRRLWLLRGALVLNFGLMGIMLALPAPESTTHADPHADPTHAASGEHLPPAPFVEPMRDPTLIVPRDRIYDEALLVGREGKYEDAAKLLQRYIEANPGLHPALMQNTYFLMEYYLRRAGRTEEAVQYGNLARRLVGQTYLPEDLWNAARAAEQSGDPRAMRQAYARLLLQRGMLTASQLAIVTEAYLKLGDSYRIEASQGAQNGIPPLGDPPHGDNHGSGGHEPGDHGERGG